MNIALKGGLLILAIIAAFLFVVAGGLDKFREPVLIILPPNFKGLLCIELLEGDSQSDSRAYVADERGRLVMESSVARSHRQRVLAWRVEGNQATVKVPAEQWTPVLTERDAASGRQFSVYWIGSPAEWAEESRRSNGLGLCVQ